MGLLASPGANANRGPSSHHGAVGRGLMVSAALHVLMVVGLLALLRERPVGPAPSSGSDAPLTFVHVVSPGRSGGGGGTRRASSPQPTAIPRQPAPQAIAAATPAVDSPAPIPTLQVSVQTDAASLLQIMGTSRIALPGPGGTNPGPGAGRGDGPGLGDGSRGEQGGGLMQIGGDVSEPQLLHKVEPQYTQAAMVAKAQGVVELDVIVRANGTVGAIRVVRTVRPDLDQSAIAAVRGWLFRPSVHKGKAVDVLVRIELTFRLH